tara:strand:- start:761 stop:2305 length:1545 start_codon:yes stop_codon:yes gene_type:complete
MFNSITGIKYAENEIKSISNFKNYMKLKTKTLYQNLEYLCNPSLSSVTFSTSFYQKAFHTKKFKEQKISKFMIFKKITIFIIWNYYNLFLWLIYKIAMILLKQKNILKKNNFILLDAPIICENTARTNKYTDRYLGSTYHILKKNKLNPVYLFFFINKKSPLSIFHFCKTIKILDKQKISYHTDFEYIGLNFIPQFLKFLNLYLIKNLKLYKEMSLSKKRIDRIFSNELILSLPKNIVPIYSRYVLGLKIGINTRKGKILSFCEYQERERVFNLAIRKNNKNIKLVAFQPIIKMPSYAHYYINDEDVDHDIVPDQIHVNGRFYIPQSSIIKYGKPISLRHKSILKRNKIENKINIVTLSANEDDNNFMLGLLKNSILANTELTIKPHPFNSLAKIRQNIEKNWSLSTENIEDLMKKSNLIITSGSGTAVEFVSNGIACIIINNKNMISSNPLTNLGKGKIWDSAYSAKGFNQAFKLLNNRTKKKNKSNIEIANKYKKIFFNRFDEKELIDICKN